MDNETAEAIREAVGDARALLDRFAVAMNTGDTARARMVAQVLENVVNGIKWTADDAHREAVTAELLGSK